MAIPSNPALSHTSAQAALEHAAAVRRAEEARQRAEEQARIAAAEARKAAEAARKLAEELRKKADEARKAAEAAEAKAEKSRAKADKAEARELRTQADKDETAALKSEASAHLAEKKQGLAESRLDDVRQRRPNDAPSEATLAAQADVKAADKTMALFEPPVDGKAGTAAAPKEAKGSSSLLDRMNKVADPVFDAQVAGVKPAKDDVAALDKSVNEWLAAAQQDMRAAAVKAQAQGKDPKEAIGSEAAKLRDAIDKDGIFEPAQMGKEIDAAGDAVKAESPAMRQLRNEQWGVEREGQKQLAEGRKAAKAADAAAGKAEAYAKRFDSGSGGNGATVTDHQNARQYARDEAARLRSLANEANRHLDGLVKRYGGTAPDLEDPNRTRDFVGSVPADYSARVADLEAGEALRDYEQAKASAGPIGPYAQPQQKQLDAAREALDLAIDARSLMHAMREDAAAALEQSDSAAELQDADAAYEAAKAAQPQPYKVKHHGNFLQGDRETTEYPEGYDLTFDIVPGQKGVDEKQVKDIDGKLYYVLDLGGDEDVKMELHPVVERLWAAHRKADAADARAASAAKALGEIQNDLIGSEGRAPNIDTGRFTKDAAGIRARLADADGKVDTVRAGFGPKGGYPQGPYAPPEPRGPRSTPTEMGVALQDQTAAKKDAAALEAMRDLRQAQYDQLAGKQIADADLAGLRTRARDAQRAADAAKPGLDPETEADIADRKLPAARDALQKQADKIAELTAPGSKASRASRDQAKTAYDRLDLVVRDHETLLELERAKQAALGARYAYDTTDFARPAKTQFEEKRYGSTFGDTIEDQVYPEDYDSTWSILPGKDGGVDPRGLPSGLSPEDVEVSFNPCGSVYTVRFKKNSDISGRESDLTMGHMVKKGSYEMHPATAKLWDATNTDKRSGGGRLTRAQDARNEVVKARRQMAADAPPAKDAAPLRGPDGKPVPALHLADDLTSRKKEVDQKVVDARKTLTGAEAALDAASGDRTRLAHERDDARASVAIAEAERTAVDDALMWQGANRARQQYDANERAGRSPGSYGKAPSERADELHARAETSRNAWYTARNAHYKEVATRELDAAEAAHDQWKKAHPGMSESGSETWEALAAARARDKHADRWRAAGALDAADAIQYRTLADNLSPELHDDPRAMAGVFNEFTRELAQPLINRHFVENGGLPAQMANRTHLRNVVADALGWPPSVALDPQAPATNDRLRRSQDLYGGLPKTQKELLEKIADRIVEDGGKNARVTVVPVVYGLERDDGGIVKTAIFKVQNKDRPGEVEFVDEQGWTYDSVDDYRANNSLPAQGVKLAMPSDGDFSLDDKGNVKLFVGDARTETGWETFRRETPVDWVVAGVGLVAGVALAVGSMGTLAAPGAMIAAGSLTLLTAGYGFTTSAMNLAQSASHGQSLNTAQSRLDMLNMGLSVLTVPVIGASTRATVQAMRARNALRAATAEAGRSGGSAAVAEKHFQAFQRLTDSAKAWGEPVSALTRPFRNLPVGLLRRTGPLDIGSAVALEEGARYLHSQWNDLQGSERANQLGMLAMNALGFASGPLARGYLRVHNTTVSHFDANGRIVDPSGPAGANAATHRPAAGSVPGMRSPAAAADADAAALPAMPAAARKPASPTPSADNKFDLASVAAVKLPLSRALPRLDLAAGAEGATAPGGGRGRPHASRPATESAQRSPTDVADPPWHRVRSPREQERMKAVHDPLAPFRESAAPAPAPVTVRLELPTAGHVVYKTMLDALTMKATLTPRSGEGWQITHGAEHGLGRTVNPTRSRTSCVNCMVTFDRMLGHPGLLMQAVPSAGKTLDPVRALHGDMPERSFANAGDARAYVASLPPGSRGYVVLNGHAMDSHGFNFVSRKGRPPEFVDAQAGRVVDGFEAPSIQVLVTHRGGSTPVDTTVISGSRLANYQDAVAATPNPRDPVVAGLPRGLRPSGEHAQVQARLMAAAPDGRTRFVVAQNRPVEFLFGTDPLPAKSRNTYATFKRAAAAAERMGGATVYRVVTPPDQPLVTKRGRAEVAEIEGALRVNANRILQPQPVLNPLRANARPAYAGESTLAEVQAATRKPTQADIDQTHYLARAGAPDGHAVRDIPVRQRFSKWARGDARHFLGAPEFDGVSFVLARDAGRLNPKEGGPAARIELLDRAHVFSDFESARAAAAAIAKTQPMPLTAAPSGLRSWMNNLTRAGRVVPGAAGHDLVGVVRLVGPKTQLAEVAATGTFRADQVDGIVGIRRDGAIHPISVSNRAAAHAPKPGDVFVDPNKALAQNDRVFSRRDKVKLAAKTTGYIMGTGLVFYAGVRLGGGSLGWSMGSASLATYVGARDLILRHAFHAFMYRGAAAGLKQGTKIRLTKHLDAEHQDLFAQLRNIGDKDKRDAALFQLASHLDSWHATRRGIGGGRTDYRQALATLAHDPTHQASLDTVTKGVIELGARQVTGRRGMLHRVPPALRERYAKALGEFQADPRNAAAAAFLMTAPDVNRATQYTGAIRGRLLRNVPGADRQRYAAAVETLASSTKAAEIDAALKTLQGLPLDTGQRHATGARGALRGIPKADRHAIHQAAETLRANPSDEGAAKVLDGSPGKVMAQTSPLGRTLLGMRVTSFALSNSGGSRLYLNRIFDPAAQQWRWDPGTLDGARNWAGNEGSIHFTWANMTGLGASVAGRYASIVKARSGKDIEARGTQASDKPPPAHSIPVGKNGRPVPRYESTEDYSFVRRFIVGLGDTKALMHTGLNDKREPLLKPSKVARLPQFSSWGDATGVIGMGVGDAILGVMYFKAGLHELAGIQLMKVGASGVLFRALKRDYLSEARANRGMGPIVYQSRLTSYFNAPLGTAKIDPTKASEGWIRRGLPPLVVLAPGVAALVAASEMSLAETEKLEAAGVSIPGRSAVSAPSKPLAPESSAPPEPAPAPSLTRPAPPPVAPTTRPQPPETSPDQPAPATYWRVDGGVLERSSFSRIAQDKGKRDKEEFSEALSQLFNLNPRYRPSLMDGVVEVRRNDPDYLLNGTRIRVE